MLFKKKLKKGRLSPSYTLMLVPHSEKAVRKFNLPVTLVKGAAIASICCLFLVSYGVFNYLNMKKNMEELNLLRSVNRYQEEKLKSLEEETKEMQTKMADVNSLELSIREMLTDSKLSSRSDSSRRRQLISFSEENTAEDTFNLLALFSSESPEDKAANWDNMLKETEAQAESLILNMNNSTQELADLREQLANRISYLKAKPTGWPVQGRITSKFGNRPSPFGRGKIESHAGLDIAAPYGSPVLATCDGKVIFAGRKAVLGKIVIIESDFGFQTVYGHNSKINVKAGDTVSRGECIANVGNTGRSTGTHLHYEVLLNGKNVDPMNYIK